MAIGSDTSTLTVAEIEAALYATSHQRLKDGKNQVAHCGNVATPTLNELRKKGRVNAKPIRDGYRVHLASPRGAALQAVSGRDIHSFQSADTVFDIDYSVGRVHLGDEIPIQELEAAGLHVDQKKLYGGGRIDLRSNTWWADTGKSLDTLGILFNLFNEKLEAFELNFTQEINKKMWLANASEAKLWTGIAGILSPTSRTTGSVGTRSRAGNEYVRHQLETSVAVADLETKLSQLVRKCNKRMHDGSRVDMIRCGEDAYDIIWQKLLTGTSSLTKLFDRVWAADKAQEIAGKLGIGYPDDAIYVNGVGVMMIEPCFEDLKNETGTDWQKYIFGMNSRHIDFKLTKGKDGTETVMHEPPYNQRVIRTSKYAEACTVASRLDCHFVCVASGS